MNPQALTDLIALGEGFTTEFKRGHALRPRAGDLRLRHFCICLLYIQIKLKRGHSMATAHTKVFMSNKSQAVRLPKAVELPESVREVDIVAIGSKRVITPAGESWDEWFNGPGVSDDFMSVREQPADARREKL